MFPMDDDEESRDSSAADGTEASDKAGVSGGLAARETLRESSSLSSAPSLPFRSPSLASFDDWSPPVVVAVGISSGESALISQI
jgi:hypothetical protein